MTEGRVPILVNKFFRVDEVTARNMLPEGSISIFENMVLDNPYGIPTIRGGFSELVSNTVNGTVGTIVDLITPSGTNRLLAGSSGRIEYLDAGTWFNLTTGLNQTDGRFRWTIFSDQLVITTGEDVPLLFTGTTWGSPTTLEITPPDTSDMYILPITSNLVGNLTTSGRYMWLLVYTTDEGDISAPSLALYDELDALGHNQVLLKNIPTSTDPRVTGIKIYRTEAYSPSLGEQKFGKHFYKVDEIENGTTIWLDNTADEDLIFSDVPIFTRTPTYAEHALTHSNRIFLGNITLEDKFFIFHWRRAKVDPASPYVHTDGYTYTSGTYGFEVVNQSTNATGLEPSLYYQWFVTFVDGNGKESTPMYSDVHQTMASGTKVKIQTAGSADGLYGIPTNRWYAYSAKRHPQISAVRLYRSKAESATFNDGQASNGYFLVWEETTSISDASRSPNTYGDATPDASLGAQYVAPTQKEYPSAIAFSRVGRPATFYLEDVRQVNQDDRDTIQAMMDDGNGILCWKQKNIYKVYTTNASQNWYVRRHINDIGCDDEWSFAVKNQTAFFRHHNRIYMMPTGSAPIDIGYYKQTTLDTLDTTLSTTITDKWVIMVVYDASASTTQSILIYDLKMETWYEFPFSSKTLEGVFVKDYAETGFVAGDFYLMRTQMIYEYTKDDPSCDITGKEAEASIEIPLFTLDAVSEWMLRKFTINFQRNGSENIDYALLDADALAGIVSYTDTDTDSGTKRIKEVKSNIITSRMYLQITGGLKQLVGLGLEVRPKRRGKFAR